MTARDLAATVREALESFPSDHDPTRFAELAAAALAALVKQAEDAQAARVRAEEALRQIAEHPVVSESKYQEDLGDWHCTITLVAVAKDALAAAGADTP